MKKHSQTLTLAALYTKVSNVRQDVDLSGRLEVVEAELGDVRGGLSSAGWSFPTLRR